MHGAGCKKTNRYHFRNSVNESIVANLRPTLRTAEPKLTTHSVSPAPARVQRRKRSFHWSTLGGTPLHRRYSACAKDAPHPAPIGTEVLPAIGIPVSCGKRSRRRRHCGTRLVLFADRKAAKPAAVLRQNAR